MTTAEIIYLVILPTFVATLGGNGLLVWLLQERFKHILQRERTEHEAAIQNKYDTEIETLKGQLGISSARFSHIFVKQADAMIELYKELLITHYAAQDLAHARPDDNEKRDEMRKKFHDAFYNFQRSFNEKKILIPPRTTNRINVCLGLVDDLTFGSSTLQMILISHPLGKNREEAIKRLNERVDILMKEIPQALDKVIEDFHTIFGIQTPKDWNTK